MQLSGKAAPIPRFLYQQFVNQGNFGQQIRPTDGKAVRVADSTFTRVMPDSILNAIGMERDKMDGRVYTANPLTATANEFVVNALSLDLPILRQTVGTPSVETKYRGKEYQEALIDQLLPAKEVYQTPEQREKK